MIFKLAVRNMKKSMSDYAVYFVTLIIGISVFYVFNSISDQTIMRTIFASKYDIIDVIGETISGASVIVSIVLAFLIVYASNFLMKRRKREFGVYMLLGMGKKKMTGILMAETVIIGLVSLVAGLGIGIVLSQGMSVLTASIFEADMSKFTFEVSGNAIIKTLVYFFAMYAMVLLLDVFVVGKSRLITLLNAGKKSEKNIAGKPFVCVIVFVISTVVLASAYYAVTAEADEITETSQLMVQIVKGIVTTFLIFWSVSGMFIVVSKLRKKSYHRGLNAFTVNEIGRRINTNVFAGSIICLLLFMTICILSTSLSMNQTLNDNMETLVPVDINLSTIPSSEMNPSIGGNTKYDGTETVSSLFEKKKVDTGMFQDSVEIQSYAKKDGGLTIVDVIGKEYLQNILPEADLQDGSYLEYLEKQWEEIIKISDYNRIATLYGLETYSLEENEYMEIANYDYYVRMRNEGLKNGNTFTIGARQYHPKYAECKDGFVHISQNRTNMGILIVPDSVDMEELVPYSNYFAANYNKDYKEGTDYIDTYVNSEKFEKKMGKNVAISTRTEIYDNSIGLTALFIFLGLYLGIVFIIASSALLSLKELSQAADSREKYQVLRKIGVDEKMIHRSLFRQNAIFFSLPLLLAVVHSIFGIQVSTYIMETFGKTGLLSSILFTAAILLAVYAVYFVVTYRCSRKIIDE